VDQFLNIKLENVQVTDEVKYPHLVRLQGTYSADLVVKGKLMDGCEAVGSEERVYKRKCGAVCALACRSGGYDIT
jgi:small nuclear ribonucleoprotein (snRNP)-like protein